MLNRIVWTDLAFLILATLAILNFAWVGYLDSDDKNHLGGILGWYSDFPYVASNHAELRHFLAIPIAASFQLFGVSEISLVIPNMLLFTGILIFTYLACSRYYNRSVALVAAALVLTLPVFAIRATVAYSDIVELFFIAASFWLFWSSFDNESQTRRLLLAGAAAGAAWLTRETTVSLLLLYGILFVLGYGIKRSHYWIMAAGFFAVLAVDVIYFAWHTGDPLFRYWMVLDTQGGITDHGLVSSGEVFDRSGNVRVFPGLDRLLVLLINHEFALFYFFAIPAGWWAWRSKELSPRERALSRSLAGLAVLWFLFVAIVLKNQHPRYFSVTTYAAAILCALWFCRCLMPRYKVYGFVALVFLIMTNLLGIYVDNKNSLFGERELVAYVKESKNTVYTDPTTHVRARVMLAFAGAEDLVVSNRPPPANALFYYNPNRLQDAQRNGREFYSAQAGWEPALQISSGRKLSGRVIGFLGIQEWLPNGVYRRLNKPNKDVTLYTVR